MKNNAAANLRPVTENRLFCYAQKTAPFLLAAIFCVIAPPVSAMDWPGANMTKNFGWNESGRPILGTVFEEENPVLAAETGEIIFSVSGKDTVSRLPSPLGAWTAVDHGDGLISIYSRYADETGSPPRRVTRNTPIAQPGISGWSGEKGFYFVLYDRRERRWVNPSMIITPLADTRPPQILSVELRDSSGMPVSDAGIAQGNYSIVVSVNDTRLGPREQPLAPHRIICSINGIEAGQVIFETLSARDGVLLVNRGGLLPARQVYAPFPAFEAGQAFLSRGQANLEVIAQDIAGNSRSVSRRIQVR